MLRRHNTLIRDFLADADRVSAAVEPVKEDVARWAEEAADTTAIQASRSERLARYWNRLPEFLGELEPTMAELSQTAQRQVPTLRKLGAAAPELERFLRSAVPFARESRESIDDLGRTADAGYAAVRESREEVAELADLSREAPRLAKPLRQFLQTIDDRRRSTEDDPLARTGRASRARQDRLPEGPGLHRDGGASGTTSTTRRSASTPSTSSATCCGSSPSPPGPARRYAANPTKQLVEQCASWLGPTQPGVLGQPDPTERAEPGALERVAARERDAAPGAHRGAGEPRATVPLPGERDISKPQIVLPEDVQELLDRLGRRRPGVELPRERAGARDPDRAPRLPAWTHETTAAEQLRSAQARCSSGRSRCS